MEFGWIAIGLLVVIVMALIFKSQDLVFIFALMKKHLFTALLIGAVLFFAFSLTHIHSTYNTDLTTLGGVAQAGKIYLIWLKNVFGNLAKVTGYAVNQDWFNFTNSTK